MPTANEPTPAAATEVPDVPGLGEPEAIEIEGATVAPRPPVIQPVSAVEIPPPA